MRTILIQWRGVGGERTIPIQWGGVRRGEEMEGIWEETERVRKTEEDESEESEVGRLWGC